MISNQIIEHMLRNVAETLSVSAAVYGRDHRLIAARGDFSDVSPRDIGGYFNSGSKAAFGDRFFLNKVIQDTDTVYVSLVRNDTHNASAASELLQTVLESLLDVLKAEMDKESFMKNLLYDNLLQIDIFNRSRTLNIRYEDKRVVFLIETAGTEQQFLHERLLKLLEDCPDDFVVGADESRQIIVHSLARVSDEEAGLRKFAEYVAEGIENICDNSCIAYGGSVRELKDVSKSYKEARLAFDVRNIFYETKKIISYAELGIGRLIYQLPLRLCNMYINETFNGREIEDLDEEMLTTANKFFENNLNVSETSRQLFIHRNTLVYRLDKIEKLMGLDLRVFDDAITFKIALMVGKYLNFMEKSDF